MWQYRNPDELYHYGILGMRWGVRRFQRKNGSLKSKKTKNRYESKDSSHAKKLGKKKLYQLSNDEIKTLNKRRQLEADYKRLNKGNIAIGIATVGTVATVLGNYKNIKSGVSTIVKDGKAVVNKMKNLVIK